MATVHAEDLVEEVATAAAVAPTPLAVPRPLKPAQLAIGRPVGIHAQTHAVRHSHACLREPNLTDMLKERKWLQQPVRVLFGGEEVCP